MKDICVPIPGFGDSENAEITLKVGGNSNTINYRVESFPWESEEDLFQDDDEVSISLARIERLKRMIREYNTAWELIQIYTPAENAKTIQVLYRMKTVLNQ
jgi:hypothetical protein